FPNHCSLWNLSKENLIEIKDYYLSSVIENHNTIISKKNITTFNTLIQQIIHWQNNASNFNQVNLELEEIKKLVYLKIKNEENNPIFCKDINYVEFISNICSQFTDAENKLIFNFLHELDT